MKRTLIVFILILPFCGQAQIKKPITGVLGISFGDSRDTVKSILSRLGNIYITENQKDKSLNVEGLTLNSRKIFFFSVSFREDKVSGITMAYYPQEPTSIIADYNSVVKQLNYTYGKGVSKITFSAPYKQGDGREAEAILKGYGIYKTYWFGSNNTTLHAMIIPTMSVIIFFNDKIVGREILEQ